MPERRDSGEGLHDVLSLPQQLSNCLLDRKLGL